jgi:hypothetical protein
VSAALSVDDVLASISAVLRARLESAPRGSVRALGVRVRMIGTTPAHRALVRAREAGDFHRLRIEERGVVGFVHDVVDRARPPFVLVRLARDPHPPGLLARQLLALERGGDEARAVLHEARMRCGEVAARPEFRDALPAPELDDASVRGLLLEAGMRALEELLRGEGARP